MIESDLIIDSLPKLVKPGSDYDYSRALALHESSHAVIIVRNFAWPEVVTLDPPNVKFRHNRIQGRFAIELHMAGTVGFAIYSGQYVWSMGDRDNLIRSINRTRATTAQLFEIWKAVHKDLAENWFWVNRVADELQSKGMLSTEDMKTIFR